MRVTRPSCCGHLPEPQSALNDWGRPVPKTKVHEHLTVDDPTSSAQLVLDRDQLDAFDFDGFVESQSQALYDLVERHSVKLDADDYVVDIGGGRGYFAKKISERYKHVKVYDMDLPSVEACRAIGVEAHQVDAIHPNPMGNERLICLNLILHHLIGPDESTTRKLQESALLAWKEQYVFVHEYCYQSFFGSSLAGKLIYSITSSKWLSRLAKAVSVLVPSLRANTFGVGVRFRASYEWTELFLDNGFKVLGVINGEPEVVSAPKRLLFIESVRRDSFLIKFDKTADG